MFNILCGDGMRNNQCSANVSKLKDRLKNIKFEKEKSGRRLFDKNEQLEILKIGEFISCPEISKAINIPRSTLYTWKSRFNKNKAKFSDISLQEVTVDLPAIEAKANPSFDLNQHIELQDKRRLEILNGPYNCHFRLEDPKLEELRVIFQSIFSIKGR